MSEDVGQELDIAALQGLFDDLVIRLDADRTVAFVNDAEPLLGYECADLVGAAVESIAAVQGEDPLDHWTTAVERFEGVGAPLVALPVVRPMLDHADEERAVDWCRRAQATLVDAPAPVVEQHEPWVEKRAADLGL